LIFILALIAIIDRDGSTSIGEIVKQRINKPIISFAVIGLAYAFSELYFKASHDYSQYIVLLGNGFLRISESSWFWNYAIIIPSASLLLFYLRDKISFSYLSIGYSLVFFSIGNLVYFFGQSNEMHLYLAGTPLIVLLFIILDLLRLTIPAFTGTAKWLNNNVDTILGVCFILAITFLCSDNIINKLKVQYSTIIKCRTHLKDPFSDKAALIKSILSDINNITGNSRKIQFFTIESENSFTEGADTEFLLYFYSDLVSLTFVNPMLARVFLDPEVLHMQELIDKGYYLLLAAPIYKKIFEPRLKRVDSVHPIKEKYVLISASDKIDTTEVKN
jgi:hypothetical protein